MKKLLRNGFPARRDVCPHCGLEQITTICTIDTEYSCDCGGKFDIPAGNTNPSLSELSALRSENAQLRLQADEMRGIVGELAKLPVKDTTATHADTLKLSGLIVRAKIISRSRSSLDKQSRSE